MVGERHHRRSQHQEVRISLESGLHGSQASFHSTGARALVFVQLCRAVIEEKEELVVCNEYNDRAAAEARR